MKKKHALITSLLALALSVWLIPTGLAAEEHEAHEGKVKIPDNAAAIVAEVKEHEAELGKLIAEKKLNKVHEVAFEIRDLVNALPEKSTGLAVDKVSKVKADAKFVDSLAERLDKTGDANDQAGTEANFKKLQSVLKQIESQYP